MTTEEILRQQIAELEKLVKLKDDRIYELIKKEVSWPFQPSQPNIPYRNDKTSDYFTKIYCGSSTDTSTNFTASIVSPPTTQKTTWEKVMEHDSY